LPQSRLERRRQAELDRGALPPDGQGIYSIDVASVKLKPGPGRSPTEVSSHQRARIHRATVEVVAERGYEATTVRELAGAAGVSTRSFYQHYPNKEACFLQVHQMLLWRLLRQLKASEADANDWRARVSLAIEAVTQAWARDPKAAHLVLIDSYSVGPSALKQLRQANQSIKMSMADERFDASRGIAPSMVIDGIVAGLHDAVRSKLLSDEWSLSAGELSDGLMRWALSCCDPLAVEVEHLAQADELQYVRVRSETRTLTTDAGALLSAAAKIAVDTEDRKITPRRISAAAGVSRRSFYENFPSVDDCLSTALEFYVNNAAVQAKRASEKALTSVGGVYRATLSLCARVAQDSVFARLCFDENIAANVAKIRRYRRPTDSISSLVENVPGADRRVAQLSAGAFWGLLQNEVTLGQARKAPRLAGVLAYLMLAPVVGASAAAEAICQEHTSVEA
jgi:AcrR family transcriptional regulator